MKLQVAHNLSDTELARSLWAVARAEGVAAHVAELLKAEPVKLPDEQYLREMILRLAAKHQPQRRAAARNVLAWLDRATAPGVLAKARPGLALTAAQIEELRKLIAAHWAPQVGALGPPDAWAIPKAVWARWRLAGVVVPTLTIPEIRDAFVAGRLYQVIERGNDYADMLRLAARAPLGRPQRLALDFAEAQAARHMTGFGERQGDEAARAALLANQGLTRDVIAQYLQGTLKVTHPQEGPPHDLLPQERQALSTDRVVSTWRGLAAELRKQFLATDPARDWLRLAHTEVTLAHNAGRLLAYEEHGLTKLRAWVQPDACEYCKRLLLHPDGTPRTFSVAEIRRNFQATGGLNMGRTASRIGEPGGWIVTGGVLHPWCFVPETKVEGSFVAGLRIPYSGPVRTIATARGHHLTVTPNHPVLTTCGWLSAALLQKGHYVVSQARHIHPASARAVEHENRPPTIAEVVDSLHAQGFRNVHIAREDLHGDGVGVNGQVQAVGPDWFLRTNLQPATPEFQKQTMLVTASMEELSLSSLGLLEQLLERGFTPSYRRPGSLTLPLDQGSVFLDAYPFQSLRFGPSTDHDPVLPETMDERRAGHADFLRQLLHGRASEVALDRIIQVLDGHWTGHVYDLQSETGWMVANGIVMSNCRCKLIPALEALP